MRKRIVLKKGVLITSTEHNKRKKAFSGNIEVVYAEMRNGNKVISESEVSIK